ncbi:cell division control protein [Nitzschia inconspicua]|uniref:Cell division control protein n=1 Tax=Nitzschia inconspicua TaxID=303405 RepID=A0A9K3KF05_9STRA|nr:cell division control protein [Nitzschia inconspicua]
METTEDLAIGAGSRDESSPHNGSGGRSLPGFSLPFFGGVRPLINNNNKSPDKSEAMSARDVTRKNPSRSNEVVAGGYTNDRYQHDVEQAKRMREGMEKRKQQQRKQQQKELTEADIELAFEGLEQVDALRQQGNIQQALKTSELSIELLIRFLRSDSSILPNVDRRMVGDQVQSALTSAEEMKHMLQNRSSLDQRTQPPTSRVDTKARQGTETLTQSLSEAIASNQYANRKKSSTTGQTSKQQRNRSSLQYAGQTTTSSPAKKNSKVATTTHHRQQPSRSTRNDAGAGRIPPSLASSDDPMVQTIKSDLYIDPSHLQSTTWHDIAGLEDAKQALQEAAILPLMRPDLFSGLRKPRNILLYGPPGTGKTMLVKAVAHESRSMLFICTASAMTSKWLGEGEKLIRALFRVARESAPSIIFIDEMDALLSARKSEGEHEASRRFKTEVMTQMDGIVKGSANDEVDGKHLLVISATNCPWDIDSAVLRRFPRRIYVPLPDPVTRKALLTNLLEKSGQFKIGKRDMSDIVKRLDGFSGSDISAIASEASFGPLRSLGGIDAIKGANPNDIRPIQRQDFDAAINQATKSVSIKLLKRYDEWKEEQAAS